MAHHRQNKPHRHKHNTYDHHSPMPSNPLLDKVRHVLSGQLERIIPNTHSERHGNHLELLRGGLEYFPKALSAIAHAQFEIRLETYIFAVDPVGQQFYEALRQAALRGVKVRCLVDGFGGKEGIQTWCEGLVAAGVDFRVFRPEKNSFLPNPKRLRRMHRKVLSVDRKIAFVGGINLVDDMNHTEERIELALGQAVVAREKSRHRLHQDLLESEMGPRYDFAVAVKGPLVQDIWTSMEWLWWQVGPAGRVTDTFTSRWWKEKAAELSEVLAAERAQPAVPPAGKAIAQFLIRDNFRFRNRIEKAYLQAIGRAHTSLVIANAYFLPGRRVRKALVQARKRGVVVKLLLQGRVEYRIQHYATVGLYAELLRHGVQIYEYLPGILHAKVAVADSYWATVGSSNLDPLSCLFAREANLVVYDRAFAVALKDELMQAINHHSRHIDPASHADRPLRERVVSWVCYKLMRLVLVAGSFGSRY